MTVFYLRAMQEEDLETVLQIRNHEEVRQYMFNPNIIDLESHRRWFHQAKQQANKILMVLVNEQEILGVVNFEALYSRQVLEWGFYVKPHSPKGSGTRLGLVALDHAFKHLAVNKVFGQVIGFNHKSIAFHKKMGFAQEGVLSEHFFDGENAHDVYCFGLLRKHWQQSQVDDVEAL